ncbi:MAG: hypothetical protein J5601_03985 [Elusimicrobiaceae bacterium]|nr:hypothetical protein [Elusimicrobiaceae bacterium]
MKKYIIAVLCVCTVLTSYAGTFHPKRFGRIAERQILEYYPDFLSSIFEHTTSSLEQMVAKEVSFDVTKGWVEKMLDATLPTRSILEEQGSISLQIPHGAFHWDSTGRNNYEREQKIFPEGMTLLDELTYELKQPIQYEAPLRSPLGDLTKYTELSKQISPLLEEISALESKGYSSSIEKQLAPLYRERQKLVEQMKAELEKQTNSNLDIRDYYRADDKLYLTKFDATIKRLTVQAKRNAENKPSRLSTLNPQELRKYATARTLEIIDFQEELRDYIRTMKPPVSSNMARLDFVLCVYKYYYSTLAGHSIPVLPYYYTKGLGSNFEAGGLMKSFKPGWADRERALFYEQPAPFSRFLGNVSPADVYPTERVAAPQATKVVDLPRANPSFEGLSSEQFAEIAENAIKKTKGYIETISLDDYNVYEGFRKEYTQIYRDSFSLIQQMAQEAESLIWQRSTLSPAAAEVQLAKILETQTTLRTFTAKILTSKNADTMIYLDYILSHYGYLYATSAGVFATVPTDLSHPYFSDHVNDTLDRWRTRLRNKNPMVSKKEVNLRRSSEQLEEGPKQSREESEEDD